MIRRKPSIICIASEETISFLMRSTNGSYNLLASRSLEAFLGDGPEGEELPKSVLQATNQLLVVPDYWVGNRFHEFQARNKSVIAAFIERKLKMEQPTLTEIAEFYNYAIVPGQNQRRQLYTFYLQEAVAYRLYRCLEALGISPLQVATPALLWQSKLNDMVDGFGQKGVGFIHLEGTDCFLYFYFMGQFLFSRTIELTDTGGDASQIYNLLNYEINQSFYLYSQKTKSAVKALFLLAPDPSAAPELSELLGQEVLGISPPPSPTGLPDDADVFPSCRAFTALDVSRRGASFISYKPLQKELAWRPVQWAGIAVGLVVVALLTIESGYLYLQSGSVEARMHQLTSAAAEPPELVLQGLSQTLDEITRELARPSGSGTIMRTLLAMPAGVSVRKISLDVSDPPILKMDAVVKAEDPDAFKTTLKAFLNQLNQRFNMKQHPLRERDVSIQLDRRDDDERNPVYHINFEFEIS